MPETRPDSSTHIETVAFISLGCPKNLVDSEKMLGLLAESGLIPVSDETCADAIVVNTCGFLEAAKDEAIEEIARVAKLKDTGACRRLVVTGCLVQRHRDQMLKWCPQIDAMIGVFDRDRIVEAVTGGPAYSSVSTDAAAACSARGIDGAGYFESDSSRLRLTPRHFAYLRIAEGCDQKCAFCTIPAIRGRMRSKSVEAICAEARELIDNGAFELNLIAQDTTAFGRDIGYNPGLAGLLEALDKTVTNASAGAGAWLRLLYAYPSRFTDAMIDAVAQLANVVKYVDLPLQHINDRVLKTMRRHTSRTLIESLLDKLRSRVPGIALRTTLISGFPGETEAEHRELVQFVCDFRFDAMGVFAYSPEPDTDAEAMHRSGLGLDDDVVARRVEELMLAQQEIAFARNAAMVDQGVESEVLIDELSDDDQEAAVVGRTYFQAPQIDGVTYVQSESNLSPGQLVRCRVVGADGYDLIAEPVAE